MVDNLNQQYKSEIRKQAVQQAAKWTLAGALALILFAATGWWLYLQPKIDEYIVSASDSMPAGAVVAFLSTESVTCPGKAWTLYEEAKGRFIVGAGHGDRSKLTPRKLGDTGGNENVVLSKDEMPAHNHGGATGGSSMGNYVEWPAGHAAAGAFSGNSPFSVVDHTHGITSEGQNQAHDNMPPYIALYFCKKTEQQ